VGLLVLLFSVGGPQFAIGRYLGSELGSELFVHNSRTQPEIRSEIEIEKAMIGLTCDPVTVLDQRLKGLEAFDKNIRGASNERPVRRLFEQTSEQDEQFIQQRTLTLGLRSIQQGQRRRRVQ
jgi:hypothetical protein